MNVDGGTVDVTGPGTSTLAHGGISTGATYSLGSGAVLDLTYGPFSFDASTTFSGAGGLEVQDGTTVVLSPGNSTYTGPTIIAGGKLQVDGSLSGSVLSFDGFAGTLSGTGTVGGFTTDRSIVSPGDNGPGILSAQGDVTLDVPTTLDVALDGATAGAGYSQLDVTGTVDLGGSQLVASLGFAPASGETFTIIQSTAPIVGTF